MKEKTKREKWSLLSFLTFSSSSSSSPWKRRMIQEEEHKMCRKQILERSRWIECKESERKKTMQRNTRNSINGIAMEKRKNNWWEEESCFADSLDFWLEIHRTLLVSQGVCPEEAQERERKEENRTEGIAIEQPLILPSLLLNRAEFWEQALRVSESCSSSRGLPFRFIELCNPKNEGIRTWDERRSRRRGGYKKHTQTIRFCIRKTAAPGELIAREDNSRREREADTEFFDRQNDKPSVLLDVSLVR